MRRLASLDGRALAERLLGYILAAILQRHALNGEGKMPVFDCHGDLQGNMVDCWFPAYLNPRWAALSAAQQKGIVNYINDVFDVAVQTPPHRFNVTESVPSDWTRTALQPLYEVAAGYDVDPSFEIHSRNASSCR